MSVKISALQEEIANLRIRLRDSESSLEKAQYHKLFTLWGREYGWRKAKPN